MNILIMGPAGAGKGTMSSHICAAFTVPHISTGDMLRENVAEGTKLGMQAKAYMEGGHLVPDEVINGMVEERLAKDDCAGGYLLDGFPRTLVQAQELTKIGERTGRPVQVVLVLNVERKILEDRITGRRICPKCGAIYHVRNHPTKKEGICDVCGSSLVQRKDDTLEKLDARMEEYERLTKPVIDYYRNMGLVYEIDASKNQDVTFEQVKKVLSDLA